MSFNIDFKAAAQNIKNGIKKFSGNDNKTQEQKNVFSQMVEWRDKQTDLTNQYWDLLDQKDGAKTKTESQKIQSQINKIEQEMAKEKNASFNFLEGDYDSSSANADQFIPKYKEQTQKIAKEDIKSRDTNNDGKLSQEEYLASEVETTNNKEADAVMKEYAQGAFKTIDIDGDGKISTNEMQGFYAALDNADGKVDGKITADAIATDFTSDKFARNIKEFQAYLQD